MTDPRSLDEPLAVTTDEISGAEIRGAVPRLPLGPALAAEFLGTFVLVFFGVGAVNAAVATGAQSGLWQVAVVWAVGNARDATAPSKFGGSMSGRTSFDVRKQLPETG